MRSEGSNGRGLLPAFDLRQPAWSASRLVVMNSLSASEFVEAETAEQLLHGGTSALGLLAGQQPRQALKLDRAAGRTAFVPGVVGVVLGTSTENRGDQPPIMAVPDRFKWVGEWGPVIREPSAGLRLPHRVVRAVQVAAHSAAERYRSAALGYAVRTLASAIRTIRTLTSVPNRSPTCSGL